MGSGSGTHHDEGFYSSLIDNYDELRDPVKRRKAQLVDYDETVIEEHVREFEELLDEVNDNWEDYATDVYHGTQEAAVDEILDTGYLLPSEFTDSDTGEIPDSSQVSASRSRAVAIFYAEEGPPTPEQAQDFVTEHLPSVTGSDTIPDVTVEKGQATFRRLVDYHLERQENLGHIEEHLYNLSERIESLGELGEPVVLGLEQEDLLHPRGDIDSVENELRNEEKGRHLGEVKCDKASVDGGIIYVPDGSREKYERMVHEENADMKVRSIGGLKLRHELEMQEDYNREGVVNIGSVWDTSREPRPGLIWEKRSYDSRPHRIDLSGGSSNSSFQRRR